MPTNRFIELKDEDLTFLQRLTAVANVIPLIAKSDLLSAEEIEIMKRSIDNLLHADIKFFSFKNGPSSSASNQPYTVCSAIADDDDNMDASLLMSSGYVQPLMPSDLHLLVQHVFDPENIACMRHLAAKKLVHAHGSSIFATPVSSMNSTSLHPDDHSTTSPLGLAMSPAVKRGTIRYGSNFSLTTHTTLSDHAHYEERAAQIRLAKWAGDLRRSLQNERMKYEAIAKGERALWLSERLDAVKRDIALELPSPMPLQTDTIGSRSLNGFSETLNRRERLLASDPLGVLQWSDQVKRKGWIALRVVGGFGILSAVAVWIARSSVIGHTGLMGCRWPYLGCFA